MNARIRAFAACAGLALLALLALLAFVELTACSASRPEALVGGRMNLPHVLREVSGIVAVDADTVACVQDEHGALYFVDLQGRRDLRTLPFGPHGDYEGLARVGDDWWVLRSDGWLLRLAPERDRLAIAASVRLPVGYREWEALCHDPARQRLLVMPKHGHADDKEGHHRPIFAFDLHRGEVVAEPVLVLHRRELARAAEAFGVKLPAKVTDKGKERADFELACSEIAVVPGTDELLLLSSIDGVLLRLARDGRLLGALRLDPTELPQPEGMSFLPDGRLLIASEGHGVSARLCVVPLP